MQDSQLSQREDASLDSSHCQPAALLVLPKDDDGGLLALEKQFSNLILELVASENDSEAAAVSPERGSSVRGNVQEDDKFEWDKEAKTKQAEAVLARLYPIELAIMATPARTIVGLGVKARHAAYVMSEYWGMPIDQIDWNARAMRLLIEAICDVARMPLPFGHLKD
jgi:hypothetical protein